MHFENLNNAGDGRGMSPWPYAMCMQWPWLEAYPEQVDQAWSRLHSILFNAHRLWNEPETTRKVIVPILTELLGFSADELSETPVPVRYAGSSALLPDFTLPGACVIEAKRMKVSLLNFSSDAANFSNPLDQAITYLDQYAVPTCLVTNGWDWYAVWKAEEGFCDAIRYNNYFGARFRLDEILADGDILAFRHFLSMFNVVCLSGHANGAVPITDFKSLLIRRKLYAQQAIHVDMSRLFFADCSDRPMSGRGSGFCPPSTPDEGGWPSRQ